MRKVFLFLFLLVSFYTWACDCKTVKVDSVVATGYDMVFEGEVVAISGGNGKSEVKFMLHELFRGTSYQSCSFEFDASSDCQMDFAPGQHWIIYSNYVSYGKGGIQFCSPSRKQMGKGQDDFYALQNGMSFDEELQFLRKTFGIHGFLVSKPMEQLHHENIKPTIAQQIMLLIASLAGVGLFYYIVKRFLR